MQCQRLHPQGLQREQVKAETGINPLQLARHQPHQMRRLAAGRGQCQITRAPFAIHPVDRQPQPPRPLFRAGHLTAEIYGQRFQMRLRVNHRLGQPHPRDPAHCILWCVQRVRRAPQRAVHQHQRVHFSRHPIKPPH